MAANTYAKKFSPGREDRSVLVLNALLGAGTALAPLFVAIVVALGAWWLLPLVVAVTVAILLFISAKDPLEASVRRRALQVQSASLGGSGCMPPPFCSTELLKP